MIFKNIYKFKVRNSKKKIINAERNIFIAKLRWAPLRSVLNLINNFENYKFF